MTDNEKSLENFKKANKIYDMLRGINGETKMNQVAVSKELHIPQPIVSKVVKTFGEYKYGNELKVRKGMVCTDEFKFLGKYDINLNGYVLQDYYGMNK